jgi:hypothetical protein
MLCGVGDGWGSTWIFSSSSRYLLKPEVVVAGPLDDVGVVDAVDLEMVTVMTRMTEVTAAQIEMSPSWSRFHETLSVEFYG